MSISTHFGDAPQWAHRHFGGVELGDVRRSRRVITLAAGWAREPGATIPRLSQGQAYASKAAYQLLGHKQTTPDALQAPHRQQVGQQLQVPGTFLLVEDTTELSWPEAAERRPGLGPVGPGKATSQGVLLHSLVAAPGLPPTPTRPPNGPLCRCWACSTSSIRCASPCRKPRKRTRMVVRVRAKTGSASRRCGPGACGRWGARRQARAGWWWPTVGVTSRSTCASARSKAWALWCGRPRQPARQVVLHVSFSPALALRAPQRPGGATGKGEPVPGSVVRVWEETGPDTAPGLEWLLLCDQPVTDFAQALVCVRQYTSRWLIEDFHKALKTGLGAEKRQLQTAHRLFAAVALLSLVAVALVDLREKSRLEPDAPAQASGLTSTELRVLRHQSRRPHRDGAGRVLGPRRTRRPPGPQGGRLPRLANPLARPPVPPPARGGR